MQSTIRALAVAAVVAAAGMSSRPLRRERETRSRSSTWARSMSAAGIVEVSGKPVKEITFTPGGTPAKVDPNGKYLVESMYVQHFTPKNLRSPCPS